MKKTRKKLKTEEKSVHDVKEVESGKEARLCKNSKVSIWPGGRGGGGGGGDGGGAGVSAWQLRGDGSPGGEEGWSEGKKAGDSGGVERKAQTDSKPLGNGLRGGGEEGEGCAINSGTRSQLRWDLGAINTGEKNESALLYWNLLHVRLQFLIKFIYIF